MEYTYNQKVIDSNTIYFSLIHFSTTFGSVSIIDVTKNERINSNKY